MNMLSSVSVNPSGFSKLLCTRLYAHIVRPQLEYDLDINRFMASQLHTLEEAQKNCIKKIYGARGKMSTKFMLYIYKLPLMSERVSILQAQFHFLYLPKRCITCLPVTSYPQYQWKPVVHPLSYTALENFTVYY